MKPLALRFSAARRGTAFCCAALLCCLLVTSACADASIGQLDHPLYGFTGNTVDTLCDSTANESALGFACADAALLASGTDIAVICGGDLGLGIEAGTVSNKDVEDAFIGTHYLVTAQISPAQLKELLEYDLSRIVVGESEYIDRSASSFAGYPHIAGFSLKYDPTAPVGARVMTITLDSGQRLEANDTRTMLRLCTTDTQFSSALDFCPEWNQVALDVTVQQALADYIAFGIKADYAREKRIFEYGVNDNSIYSRIPKGAVLLLVLIFVLCNGQRFKKHFNFTR